MEVDARSRSRPREDEEEGVDSDDLPALSDGGDFPSEYKPPGSSDGFPDISKANKSFSKIKAMRSHKPAS